MSQQQYIKDVCCSSLPNTSEYHKIRAALYRQSYLIFQKLHQKSTPITVNQAAKEYDDTLNEQIELVEQYYHELALNKERQEYLKLSAIWQLCKIVYFSDQKDDIEALIKWYNRINSSLYYEYDRQAIFNHPDGPLEHPSFWPFAIRMTLLGRIDQLSALLKHTLPDVSFSRNSDILPYIIALNDITIDFPLNKEKLSAIMANLQASKRFSPKIDYHAQQLLAVLAILSGDEMITLEHTQDDIHAYICCRFYQSAVGSFTDFTARHPSSSNQNSFSSLLPPQNVLRSIIAGDIYQAIEECVHYDWWLLAHLTDLLSMNQMIDRDINIPVRQDTVSVPVKSHFILYYASTLKNQFGLWKQAYSYMFECGELGRQAVIEHMSNMDLNVDDNALTEVVDFCNHHSLESTGVELYKRKAAMCMEAKDYKKALYYYRTSKQHQYIDTVFYEMIWHLAMTGEWSDISSLSPERYDGIYYTIYKHLHNLHNHIERSELKEAAHEFRALVESDSVPNHIMAIVIWEGLALVRDLDASQLTAADILRIKSQWQKLNKLSPAQDFKLLYFYNNQDKLNVPERNGDLENVLKYQKQDFLDTTGVWFSRALEKTDS
ncbi:uncharacterized protein ATC70_011433 [Mucor velutinosus]|uniref:Nuclear pore complex protein Nup85 n=1 Tax=Mucor velutinosus TaxID=708070 RepID=A0AAN7DK41_9FUNG|nr:hypothetical protein ATC70_011433 [Mucor velutinosus]